MISYVGHMSDQSANADWKALRWAMTSVGLPSIEQSLERVERPSTDRCKQEMREFAEPDELPPYVAVPLCEDMLEDYVCLGFKLPKPCRENQTLQSKFESMIAFVEQVHGRAAPLFE